ncbi:MAG TPA: hypothetical protein PKC80_05735 [Burkholderiaceae bacterium]|nr:hypothetical protein [Burkholderiaceae bacterium]
MQNFADTAVGSTESRTTFRTLSRQVFKDRNNVALHQLRLQAAMSLPGTEPTQGALIDLFVGCFQATERDRQDALDSVQSHLNPLLVVKLKPYIANPNLAASNALATRWSVLISPSLDMPRRTMRCNTDDSRVHAQNAVRAWQANDVIAQNAFLEHCVICQDKLAFLLARRSLLQLLEDLPATWEAVGKQLEMMTTTS